MTVTESVQVTTAEPSREATTAALAAESAAGPTRSALCSFYSALHSIAQMKTHKKQKAVEVVANGK